MSFKIEKDRLPELAAALKALANRAVSVGIAEENATRKPEGGHDAAITNAALGYVHEFGEPALNIPPRPFLFPGVDSVKDKIASGFKKAGDAALDGRLDDMERQLDAVGLTAATAVVRKFSDGSMAPIKDDTKRGRLERKAAYKGASEKRRAKMMASYLEGDFTPLVDTGALRQSITWVVTGSRGGARRVGKMPGGK